MISRRQSVNLLCWGKRKIFCVTWRFCLIACNNGLKFFFSALQMENKSVWTSVPQTACTSCVGKLSGDSTADQEHILNYVFLCGLVCNLINCGNVARMSQLSVAPQSIPKESHSVLSLLIISALPSMAPPPRAQITSLSHTFDKKKILFAALMMMISHSCSNYSWICFPRSCGLSSFGSDAGRTERSDAKLHRQRKTATNI